MTMKKSQALLLKLSKTFGKKYAQINQSLQQIIENAASWGENSANGIMNFPAQLKKDQADMTINITISSGTLRDYNVDVSQPIIDPAQFSANYQNVPEQIKNYLEKHIADFAQVPVGTNTLTFVGKENHGIAQR